MKSTSSTFKILLVILTLISGISLNSTTSYSQVPYGGLGPTGRTAASDAPRVDATAADLSPTCSPDVWNSMVNIAAAKAQRRTVIAQSLITKPDKTDAMVCLQEALLIAAAKIGAIFSDNPSFSGGCDFAGGMISTMLEVLMAVETAENLGGGILDGTNRDGIIDAVLRGLVGDFLTGTFSGLISGFISSLFGGGCLGDILGGAMGAVVDNIGAQLSESACNNMNTVWQGIAMQSVDNKYFMTARQLRDSDPRYDVAGVPPDAFATALLTTAIADKVDGREIFGHAINVDLDDVLGGPTFRTIAENHFRRLAPYHPVDNPNCYELPILGPYISCNRGCVVTGTLPALSCIPAP